WGTRMRELGGILRTGVSIQLDAPNVVDAFTPPNFPRTFEELKVPLYVVATDYQSWHQVVLNSGLLRPAIAGSIAIPTLFKLMVHSNHVVVAMGAVNPLPLDQADIGTDILIGIDATGDPSQSIGKTAHTAIAMCFGSAQIMM